MEIGPVASIRVAPMVRPKEAYLGLTDVNEVEHITLSSDEIYIPSGSKATSGFEDEEDKYEELGDELNAELRGQTEVNVKISHFA